MGYNDLSEWEERVAEKYRIISRLTEIQADMTRVESDFVAKMANYNWVSVKQLFWLRDINCKY